MLDRNIRLSLGASLAVGSLWLFCSLFVWIAPEMSARLTGYMIHMEAEFTWQLEPGGAVIGGMLWMMMSFALVFLSLSLRDLFERTRK